jgi:FMN phosphatase YigB (HAD superfamily)
MWPYQMMEQLAMACRRITTNGLFVGDDAEYDNAGARAAGMATAWVTGPAGRGIESVADFRIGM